MDIFEQSFSSSLSTTSSLSISIVPPNTDYGNRNVAADKLGIEVQDFLDEKPQHGNGNLYYPKHVNR